MVDDFDPTKLLDTKLAEKLYDDALAPSSKQVGGLAEDLIKTFRLFTAPIQYLATLQDRYEKWLEDVRRRVPKNKQTIAPAAIAGPVLLNLRFEDENSSIKEMYLNLLTKAIDIEQQKYAHPAFIKVIEQLSPDEANFLCWLNRIGSKRNDFSTK